MSDTRRTALLLCEDGTVLERILSVTERCGCRTAVVEDTMDVLAAIDAGAGVLVAYFTRLEPLYLRFVRKLDQRSPSLGIIVMGEQNTAAAAVDAMRSGADYYVAAGELEVRLPDALEGLFEVPHASAGSMLSDTGAAGRSVDTPASMHGLRDALSSLVALSRNAMSALDDAPLRSAQARTQDGVWWFEQGMSMRDLERRAIEEALRECDNNRTRAAGVLQISIRTLHRKIREYELR